MDRPSRCATCGRDVAPGWTTVCEHCGKPLTSVTADARESPRSPARRPGRRRAALLGGGIVAVAAVGGLAFKVITAMLAAEIVGQSLGLLFGGPYQRLPADARTVSGADVDAQLTAAIDGLPAPDLASVQSLAGGEAVTDAAACSAERSLHRQLVALAPDDFALVARYWVSP